MNAPKRRKRPPPQQPRWFVVRAGWIQYVGRNDNGTHRVVLPLFSDRKTAVRFIESYLVHMNGGDRGPLRPAEIGTVQGETLRGVLADAAAGGVDAAVWVQTVREDSYTFREMSLARADA